ncbi:hypothetical protein [Streptomyces sp. LB8]|uniref:Uncharacterized protein n=2 Tax=Streptomyces TaxID=1883 RepID=A0ABN1T1J0_9ACTN|nr:hypothetical protein [Streptomyces sp. LB8]
MDMSVKEEYVRRAVAEHCGQLVRAGAVPIGSFTSNAPQRLHEYSYVAIGHLRPGASSARADARLKQADGSRELHA